MASQQHVVRLNAAERAQVRAVLTAGTAAAHTQRHARGQSSRAFCCRVQMMPLVLRSAARSANARL